MGSHLFCGFLDTFRRYPGQLRRPPGIFGDAVLFAHQVGEKALKPRAVSVEKMTVMEVVHHQGMGHPQHDGNVAVGPARPPLCVKVIRHVVLYRADVHEPDPGLFQILQLVPGRMRAQAAGHDLGVFHGDAAETHDQPGVFCDVLNGGSLHHQVCKTNAQRVRHYHFRSGSGIRVD